jgi:hypothetical protein
VKWAKNHGKNINSFYEALGKSIELKKKEKPGKSNYSLQLELKEK